MEVKRKENKKGGETMSIPIRKFGWGHHSFGHRFTERGTDLGSSHPWGPTWGYDLYYPGSGHRGLHGLKPEEAKLLAKKHNLPLPKY